ncbi:MAG: hypothetical protein ACR2JE_10460 [Acidobacteriaceae bacterium]
MTEQIEQDVRERIALIETMMLEGRKTTEYYGWTFALWGVAYLVAIAWTYATGAAGWAWTVTMVVAGIVTSIALGLKRKKQPETTRSRAIGAVWAATGAALFGYTFAAAFTGHAEIHGFIAAVEIMLCVANLTGGILLRWVAQQVVGGIWWTAAVYTFFLKPNHVWIAFVAAIVVCQIGFGIYLMVLQARAKARARMGQVSHA